MSERRRPDLKKSQLKPSEISEQERREREYDRRVIERFLNEAVIEATVQLKFWLKILFIVITASGVFVLIDGLFKGIRQAGPSILIAIIHFTFTVLIYAVRKQIDNYLSSESLVSFELVFEKLMHVIRLATVYSVMLLSAYVILSI